MHKASTQSFTTAYDACTITTAKTTLAVEAANSNVSLDVTAITVTADPSAVTLNITAPHRQLPSCVLLLQIVSGITPSLPSLV